LYVSPTLLKRLTLADSILVDYNSWVESEQGLKLAATLDKDRCFGRRY